MNRPYLHAAVLAASLSLASVAEAVPTYQGSVTAQDYNVVPIETNRAGTTTSIPAAYLIAAGGGTHAESVSQSIDNGTVESTATSGYSGVANAFTEIRYTFSLVPLPGAMTLPNGTVPVRFIANGAASGQGLGTVGSYGPYYNASATFEALFDNQTHYIQGAASAGSNGMVDSFVLDQVVDLLPGASVLVILSASAQAGLPGGDPSTAHAFVDPQFIVDPAFAAFYAFDGLPVTPQAPGDPGDPTPPGGGTVPEPATVSLLFAGVAAVGLRRSRRRPAAA